MTKWPHMWVTISTSILLSPLVVNAQQRAASPPAPPMAAPAHPVVAAPAFPPRSHTISPLVVHPSRTGSLGAHRVSSRVTGYLASTHEPVHSSGVRTNSGTSSAPGVLRPDFTDDTYATPGLGFDYPHFAAVHPGESHRNAYRYGGAIFPFVGGGIYLPTTGYVDGGAPQRFADDSQQVEAAEPAPDYPEAGPVEQTPISGRVRMNSSPAPTPSPEYIFVRRDGTVFFAVAYSWSNGNLQYVTQDGLRKLTALSTLDLDATAQFNEQRGVAFHFPA